MAKKENENKVKKHFLKDFKAELKKVIWPTPKQLFNNTVAVVTIVLLTAIIVFALDVIFDLGNKYGINKLQTIVNEKFNSEEENTDNNSTDNGEDTNPDEANTEGENSEDNIVTDDTNTSEQNPETDNSEQTNPEQ